MQIIWPFLAIVLLTVHLIGMQFAAAAPVVWCLVRKGSKYPECDTVARKLAARATGGLVLGVVLGLALAGLATVFDMRDYSYVIAKFYKRVWWGGWELLFSLVLLLICWVPWRFWMASGWRRGIQGFLSIVTATNLLYHFPPLLTVMAEHLSVAPEGSDPVAAISSAEFRGLIARPIVIAKSLHFGLAAIAISAAELLVLCSKNGQNAPSQENGVELNSTIRRAAGIALVAMALQMVVGMALVMLVPASEQSALMGGDLWAAGSLILGVILSLVVMNQLGTLAMEDSLSAVPASKVRLSGRLVFLVTILMIAAAFRTSGLS